MTESDSEVAQSCPTLCNSMDCSLPGFSIHGIFQASTGVGYHFLLQEIFPTQGLNPGLQHCRQTLYCLSHQILTVSNFSMELKGQTMINETDLSAQKQTQTKKKSQLIS